MRRHASGESREAMARRAEPLPVRAHRSLLPAQRLGLELAVHIAMLTASPSCKP